MGSLRSTVMEGEQRERGGFLSSSRLCSRHSPLPGPQSLHLQHVGRMMGLNQFGVPSPGMTSGKVKKNLLNSIYVELQGVLWNKEKPLHGPC